MSLKIIRTRENKKVISSRPKGINKMKLLSKMMLEDILLSLMEFVPDHFKRKEMYNEAMRDNQWLLGYIPDQYKPKKCVIRQ